MTIAATPMVEGTALVRAGQARWPDVELTSLHWQTWLLAAGSSPTDPRPRALELFLTVASGHGDAAAIAHLQRDHLAPVLAALRRRGTLAAAQHDDAVARLSARLWVAAPPRAPAILDYQGLGPLRVWLHVVARRALLTAYRDHARASPTVADDTVVAALVSDDSPGASVVAADSRAHVKAAYADAVSTLEARQRVLLRMHICDRVGLDALAATYQVNRVTIARWLDRARRELAAQVHARLSATLGLAPSEVESLLRAARDDFELSVERLL